MTVASTEMTTIVNSKPDIDTLVGKIEDLNNLVLSLQASFNYRIQANEGIQDTPDRMLLEKIVADCSQLLKLAGAI
jgi:hypothetical protein